MMRSWYPVSKFWTPPAVTIGFATLAFALVGAPHAAHAQVTVYDNGSPTSGAAGVGSDSDLPEYFADTFTFTKATTFDEVIWYGSYDPLNVAATPDDFTLALFGTTTGGTPNATPIASQDIHGAETRTSTGLANSAGDTIYKYTFTYGSSEALAAGTYGLGISDNTTSDTSSDWYWDTSTAGTSYFRSSNSGAFTGAAAGNLAFQLVENNAVTATPEPGVVVTGLSMLSMTGLGLVRGRIRRGKTSVAA